MQGKQATKRWRLTKWETRASRGSNNRVVSRTISLDCG